MERFYPIGTPGEPWTDAERREWFEFRTIERSYQADVVRRIESLPDTFEVAQYGALPLDEGRYPLFVATQISVSPNAPWALIAGGVHGYETSGVHGALDFASLVAADYRDRVNLVVAPCVSPWGYEVINRWNPNCLDPNRSFHANSPSEEAAALLQLVDLLGVQFLLHMDLH